MRNLPVKRRPQLVPREICWTEFARWNDSLYVPSYANEDYWWRRHHRRHITTFNSLRMINCSRILSAIHVILSLALFQIWSVSCIINLSSFNMSEARWLLIQFQRWLFFETASKLIFFPDHFLPNCFRLLVLHTVYTSGLAVFVL